MGEEELGNVDFGIVEETATEVAEDGTIITETVTAIIDEETGESVVDTVIDIVTPDGSEVIEETLAVVDAEGNVEILAEGEGEEAEGD